MILQCSQKALLLIFHFCIWHWSIHKYVWFCLLSVSIIYEHFQKTKLIIKNYYRKYSLDSVPMEHQFFFFGTLDSGKWGSTRFITVLSDHLSDKLLRRTCLSNCIYTFLYQHIKRKGKRKKSLVVAIIQFVCLHCKLLSIFGSLQNISSSRGAVKTTEESKQILNWLRTSICYCCMLLKYLKIR